MMARRVGPWVLIAGLAAGRLLSLPPTLLAPLAWFAIVLLPGHLVARWILPDRDPSVPHHRVWDGWLETTAAGLLAQSIWVSIADLLQIPFDMIVFAPVLLAAAIVTWAEPRAPARGPRLDWSSSLPSLVLILLGLALAVRLALIPLTGSDALAHLDGIRQVVATGEPYPHVGIPDGMAGLKPDPRFGSWHPIVASVWRLAGGELVTTWVMVGLLVAVPFLLAIDLMGRALWGSWKGGVASLAVYALLVWQIEGELLGLLAFPSVATRPVFVVGVVWLLGTLRRGSLTRRDRIWSGVFGAGLSMLRLDYLTMFMGLFLLVVLLDAWLTPHRARTWLLPCLGISLAAAAPFLIYKYALSLPVPASYLASNETGHLYLWGNWHVTDPIRVLGVSGCVLTLLALAWFLRACRSLDRSTAVVLGAMWIGGLQAYNPLFYAAFEPILSAPYVQRLTKLLPVYWVVAAALIRTGFTEPRRWMGWGLRALTVTILLAAGASNLRTLSPSVLAQRNRTAEAITDMKLLDWLRVNGSGETTVLAHARLGYIIAGLTNARVVAVPPAHASPWVLDAQQRQRDALLALSPCLSPAQRVEILHRYTVDWVVVSRPDHGLGATRPQEPDPGTSANGPAHDGALFETGGFAVYPAEVAARWEKEEGRACGEPFSEAEVPANAAPMYPRIRAALRPPLERSVEAGGTLRIPVTWYCDAPTRTAPRWIARFDREFPRGVLYSAAVGKPYRKLVEAYTGRLYRFRWEGNPGELSLPSFAWSPGRKYEELIEIPVPKSLHPGTYEMQLKLLDLESKPILTLSDYLRNEDLYVGEPVGQVVIPDPRDLGNAP